MSTNLRTIALAGALALLPAIVSAQALVGRSDSVYVWHGQMAPGRQLSVSNFNGPIEVRAAAGTTAEVRAEKHTRGGAVSDIAFDVQVESGGDVRICSVMRNSDGCDDQHRWSHDDDDDRWRRNESVSMVILVPRGAKLKVATGNGTIVVDRAGAEVEAATGNGRVSLAGTEGVVRVSTGNGDVDVRDAKGSVRVSTGNGRVSVATSEGPVEARSGNGDIDVRMSSVRAREDMSFSTGSGAVRLTLPAGYNGELDASTGNGEVTSDFDLKVQGRMNPRRIRATIGAGGPLLRMSTGNGRLELRKGD
jgi:Putative adhesin